jgi:hypothetical protein
MTEIPSIADIIASYSNQDKTLEESAADLGAIILEMEREEECYGKHTNRLAELKELAAFQEKVVNRMLVRSTEGHNQPKRPHLTVVK